MKEQNGSLRIRVQLDLMGTFWVLMAASFVFLMLIDRDMPRLL